MTLAIFDVDMMPTVAFHLWAVEIISRLVAKLGASIKEMARHRVVVVGPAASHAFLARLFDEERPDIIHSFGRGPFGLLSAAYWRQRLRKHGTRRVHDVDGILLSDGHVDGSLTGALLEAAYLRVLGFRGRDVLIHRDDMVLMGGDRT